MKFHKLTYPILMHKSCPERIKIVTGWANEDESFAFHKVSENCWHATEMSTGSSVYCGPTKKKCAEWVETHQDFINEKKKTHYFEDLIKEFQKCLEEYKKEQAE